MSFKGHKHSKEIKKKWSEERCGKNNSFYGKKHSKETKEKISKANRGKLKGKRSNHWIGGRVKTAGGYIAVHKPEHPQAEKCGYILEHRYLMERHIGRHLREEERIHHINGIINDNRIGNLKLCGSAALHMTIHRNPINGQFQKYKI